MPSPTDEDPFRDGLPTIESRGLRLRAFRHADADDVFRLYCDKDAVRFGYSPRMEEPSDAIVVIEETARLARARTVFHWGVADGEDRIVGHATLFHLEKRHRRAEIGYSIRRDLWGRGLGTRAAAVLVDFAFGALDLRRIEADVDPRNTGSLRLLEKLGFVREGYFRQRWEIQGEVQDGVAFGLLRSEWRPER
jgi:ribosomal-protein-alanine N-acetyltransferase